MVGIVLRVAERKGRSQIGSIQGGAFDLYSNEQMVLICVSAFLQLWSHAVPILFLFTQFV